jgi:hypothetical protein
MWQIQWVIGLIPTSVLLWIYMTILGTGVFLYIGSKLAARWPFRWIPIIGQYRIAAEIVGVILTVLGIYLYGGYGTEMAWRDRVAELEAKVAKSEAESKDANVKLDAAIKAKTKTIKEVQVVIKERIKEVEKRIDADCKIDKEAVDILNDSAKNQKGRK